MSPIAAYGFVVEDEHLVEVYDHLYFCASLESEDILDPSATEGHFKVRQVYRRADSLVEVYFKDKKKNSLGAITINYYLTEEEERFVEQNPCVTPPFVLERFKDMIGTDN